MGGLHLNWRGTNILIARFSDATQEGLNKSGRGCDPKRINVRDGNRESHIHVIVTNFNRCDSQ